MSTTSTSDYADTPPSSTASSSYVLPPRTPSSSSGEGLLGDSSEDIGSGGGPRFDGDDGSESTASPSEEGDSEFDGSSDGGDEEARRLADAEREWRESLQQLELLLTMVVVPYLGKYFGRKCAYWGWAKFMEWKYPVEIVMTSPKTFKAAGAVEAAASL